MSCPVCKEPRTWYIDGFDVEEWYYSCGCGGRNATGIDGDRSLLSVKTLIDEVSVGEGAKAPAHEEK